MFLTVKLYPLPQVPFPLWTHFLQRPPESASQGIKVGVGGAITPWRDICILFECWVRSLWMVSVTWALGLRECTTIRDKLPRFDHVRLRGGHLCSSWHRLDGTELTKGDTMRSGGYGLTSYPEGSAVTPGFWKTLSVTLWQCLIKGFGG